MRLAASIIDQGGGDAIRRCRNGVPVYGNAQTDRPSACSNHSVGGPQEIHMFIGGGILGTILVIALIVYFVRRV
jgi:hypothetical protein